MTQEQALATGLINAFLWGSWSVFIKRLGSYPLDAFFVMLYVFSFVLVWGIALATQDRKVFMEISEVWRQQPALILGTLAAGATYLLGVRITISLFSTIGLSLTASIQTFMSLVVGTLLAAWVGGLPSGIWNLAG